MKKIKKGKKKNEKIERQCWWKHKMILQNSQMENFLILAQVENFTILYFL